MDDPVGVILAGGAGRRIGGAKATVSLCGKPLISYPLEALRQVLSDVAILAKPDSELPPLPGVSVWREPERTRHPLIGITRALALAHGRPVLVCALDMPLVNAEVIAMLARADPGERPAVIAARADGSLEPLLGCYQPRAAASLASAALAAREPVREVVARIGPRLLEIEDPQLLLNINSPDDLLQAATILVAASHQSHSSSEEAG